MPFDPTDPFNLYPQRRQPAQLPTLTPEEEDSLLTRVGQKALGGLGYVGHFLDKYTGGRAVRGLLGGKGQELLSLLPFSDALGITDEKNLVSGRDLSNQWGWSNTGSDSWLDTAKGIGVDILTNPTTYLTFGGSALTEAGEAAKRLGALPETMLGRIRGYQGIGDFPAAAVQKAADVGVNVADLVGQHVARAGAPGVLDFAAKPLGGVAGIGLPFMKPSAILGAGPGGESFLNALGTAGGAVGKAARYVPGVSGLLDNVVEPTGRVLNSLFNYKLAGAQSAGGQEVGRAYTTGVAQELQGLRGAQADLIRQAEGLTASTGKNFLEEGGLLRRIGESKAMGPPATADEQLAQTLLNPMREFSDKSRAAGHALGYEPYNLADTEAEYLARHMALPEKSTRGYGGGVANPLEPSTLGAREDALRNVPGSTETLNKLSLDPDISGVLGRHGPAHMTPGGQAPYTALQREELVRGRYLGVTPAEEATIGGLLTKRSQGGPLAPDEAALLAKYDQSAGLTRWAEKLDPAHADAGKPFFGHHPLEDWFTTERATIQRNAAGSAAQDLFARTAQDSAGAGPGWVRLDQALEKAGFTDLGAAQKSVMGRVGGRAGANDVLNLYVPPEAVADATRFVQGLQVPAGLRPLTGALDWITNLTKAAQTAIWPGFHARNYMSGQVQNLATEAVNPMTLLGATRDADKILRGGTVEGSAEIPYMMNALAKKLGRAPTDAEATKAVADLAYQYGAVSGGVHQIGDVAPATAIANKVPGMVPFEGYWNTLGEALPTSGAAANPLNISGVSSNADLFAPIAAGRKIGTAVEDTNRLSGFLGHLQQGVHPEDAARLVREAHVDYAALAPFEKEVMRRLIPFYSYSRGIIPNVAGQLATRPGGVAGQLAMATDAMRQEGGTHGLLPEYMGGGLAIPTGKEQDGTQRFLSRLDTPVESAFEHLRPTLPDSLLSMLGMTNPVIKAPLEVATGKQFFSGRDLGDLYPITGNTILDQVAMNSPISRLVTTGRTLADERKDIGTKALNLLTGARLSDVDMQKQRDIAARELIADSLKGQQGIGRSESFYLRPGALEQLTPEQIALLRLERTIEQRARSQNRIGIQR